MCFQYAVCRKRDRGCSDAEGSHLQLEGFYHCPVIIHTSEPQDLFTPAPGDSGYSRLENLMSAWPHRPLCLLQHLKIQIIRLVPAWLRMVNMWAHAWAIHSDLLFATYSVLTKGGGRKQLRGRPRASGICVMLFSHRWFSLSVVSDSLWLHGLEHARLLCPWGFSRQEYWSGWPCPLPGDLPNPGIEPRSPASQTDSTNWDISKKSF